MKILSIILLVLGAIVNFIGPKILKKVLKQDQIEENKKVMVKSIGLLLVIIGAVIAFVVIK